MRHRANPSTDLMLLGGSRNSLLARWYAAPRQRISDLFLKRSKPREPGRDEGTCGWIETAPPRSGYTRLTGDEKVDCAVIGAGFTGLATARRLAQLRPDWRIAVLEAQRLGLATSGRASGFVVDLTDFATRLGPRDQERYVRLGRVGLEILRDLVEEYSIECDWDETGWIRAAAGDAGVRFLESMPALYRKLGIDFEPLDAEGIRGVTGSSFYRQGIRLPGYPLVQPAALVVGLARILPENVEIYEQSPVTAIENGPNFRLAVNGATVTADRLFLATNGYTPRLGYLHRRIFPLYTFGSLTRVLSSEEQQALGGESEWGILAMDPMGSTVRRTRDQRLLIRNTVYYNKRLEIDKSKRAEVRRNHRRAFLARFPMLEDVEFEYTWAGLMGTSKNGQTSFGKLGENFYVAAAYTAAGIAMSQTAGKLLSEYAVGMGSGLLEDMLALPKPTWMPPDPFRSVGGGWLAERMNHQARECL